MELLRLFRTKSFWVALMIGFCFVGSHILTVVLPYAKANVGVIRDNPMYVPFSSGMFFMGYDMYGWQGAIFYRIMPLLAAIPYANSYYCDISGGYIKNLHGRCKKENYLIAKYMVTFLSGGVIMLLPLLLDIFCCMALLPTHQPVCIGVYTISFPSMFYENTMLYIVIFLFADFLIGGLYAVTAFLGTEFIANKYLLVIFPYLLVTIWQMLLQVLNLAWFDPVQLSNPDLEIGTSTNYLILISAWLLVTFGVYFIRGRGRDEVV